MHDSHAVVKSKRSLAVAAGVVVGLFFFQILWAGAALCLTGHGLKEITAGEFGDLFGGFNGFVSALAFAAIVVQLNWQREGLEGQRLALVSQSESLQGQAKALELQHEALTLQREEMALQREEMTLQREEMAGQREELRLQRESAEHAEKYRVEPVVMLHSVKYLTHGSVERRKVIFRIGNRSPHLCWGVSARVIGILKSDRGVRELPVYEGSAGVAVLMAQDDSDFLQFAGDIARLTHLWVEVTYRNVAGGRFRAHFMLVPSNTSVVGFAIESIPGDLQDVVMTIEGFDKMAQRFGIGGV